MRGLIWKDVLVNRAQLRMYGIFLAVYLVLARAGILNLTGLVCILAVVLFVLTLNVFAYDDESRWDPCVLCLPGGRRQAVLARTLFVLLLLGFVSAAGALVALMPGLQGREGMLRSMLELCTFFLFILDVLLPLLWYLGVERARPFAITLVMFPLVGLALLEKAEALEPLEKLLGPLFLLALAGMGVSIIVSLHIVEKKEY